MNDSITVVAACDLGTGGCKSALVDISGNVIDSAFVPYDTFYPQAGWHEQRPSDWWNAVAGSIKTMLDRASSAIDVAAVGLSGQSLALVPCASDASPLRDTVPIWSDARAETQATDYFAKVDETVWYRKTGNGFPPPLYTIFKAIWLRENEPDIYDESRWLLGSKDWINAQLTGQILTDHSYASGFGAYDLRARRYDEQLLDAADIDQALLPPIVASHAVIGTVTAEAAIVTGLPAGTPVVAGGVDNSCMSLGAGLDRAGQTYLSLGSSNWLTVATDEPILDDTHRPYVFDHVLDGLYVSAYSTFGGGSSLSWLSDLLDTPLPELMELAATSPKASGLVCVPTLAGGTVAEGGPDVRGAFFGLDLGHEKGALARAVIEGIAFSLAGTAALLSAKTDLPSQIIAVGGGAKSSLLIETLATVLDRDIVQVTHDQHAAASGAAALALIGVGLWDDAAPLAAARELHGVVAPSSDAETREALSRLGQLFEVAASATAASAPLVRAARDLSQAATPSISTQ